MPDGPGGFQRNFSCSAVLRIQSLEVGISFTGLSPSLAVLPSTFNYLTLSLGLSYNPEKQASRFGLFPFRSPLLWESKFLSAPAGTEMFQFSACLSVHLCIQYTVTSGKGCRVSPFGNLRIKAYLQLPEAYRRSSRPSSTLDT